MRRWILPGLALALVLAGGAAYLVLEWAQAPVAGPSESVPTKIVIIPEGSRFQQAAALLKQEGLIRSRSAFVLLGRVQAADRRIHPGEYEFSAAMPPADILAKLLAGRVVLHPVTIPEGLTLPQIADVVGQHGIADPIEFLRLAKSREFSATQGIPADTLEGYLYPDTYRFPRNMKAKDVIQTMVGQLRTVYGPELQARARELGLTDHEVLTLASVIEKETSVGEERHLISAVFHNRLKKKIPLQSDPTVIYGLPEFDGNIHKKDLSSLSPYNTYRVRGLPPGPIASPGIESIKAALYPAEAPYLYFVSKNDGTHHFSVTLIEHNRAVDKYQKRPFRRMVYRKA